MLIEFAENNINYSIMYGTLLGAVRNGVFIPWDDDCDVVFKRDEYKKFFEACKKDLDTSRLFLREHRTNHVICSGIVNQEEMMPYLRELIKVT